MQIHSSIILYEGASVWIHTFDGRKPDDMAICLKVAAYVEFNGSKPVYLCGLHCLYSNNTGTKSELRFKGAAGVKFIVNKCRGAYAGGIGIEIIDLDEAFLFDCHALDNGRYGFNYHASSLASNPKENIVEFNPTAHTSGNNEDTTSNATLLMTRLQY